VLLLIAPQLTRGFGRIDAGLSRWLLGPPSDLAARVTELESSRERVVDAAETERRRIERDLHDGAQQRLVALAMDLGRAKAKFADDLDAAAGLVDQAHAQAKEALVELRNLVRGVHPPVLTERGLDAALSGLAALCPVPVEVHVDVLVREGLTRLLTEAGHEVAAAEGDAEKFLRAVDAHRPDAVVVDVRMPPTFTDEGLRAALVVRDRWPDTGVLVLSQWVEERYAT